MKKLTYIMFSYSWKSGGRSGNGYRIKGFSEFNGKIGKRSIADLENEFKNDDIFKNEINEDFSFFINSISVLGEMTEEEWENE